MCISNEAFLKKIIYIHIHIYYKKRMIHIYKRININMDYVLKSVCVWKIFNVCMCVLSMHVCVYSNININHSIICTYVCVCIHVLSYHTYIHIVYIIISVQLCRKEGMRIIHKYSNKHTYLNLIFICYLLSMFVCSCCCIIKSSIPKIYIQL